MTRWICLLAILFLGTACFGQGTFVASPIPYMSETPAPAPQPEPETQPEPDPAPQPDTNNEQDEFLSQQELVSFVSQAYPSRRYSVRYADVRPRSAVWSHLRSHGYTAEQVNGLPQWVALGLHDLTHGGKISPRRVKASPTPVRTAIGIGCANGQCARQASTASSGRLFPNLFRKR